MAESNPLVTLAAFHADALKELEITLKDLIIIKHGRTPMAVIFRAWSADNAWAKAQSLADAGVGVELRKITTMHYNTLWVNPVGVINKMVRDDPSAAILVNEVPNNLPFILIQALVPDVDVDAVAEFRFND